MLHVFYGADFLSGQDFRFTQIGSDEAGQRNKLGRNGFYGFVFHQLASAGRHHNRVEYDEFRAIFMNGFCYYPYDFRVVNHSDFHSLRANVIHNGLYLSFYVSRGDRVNAFYAERILHGNGGNGTGCVCSQRGYSFNIGLYACTTAAVGSGDGQDAWICSHFQLIIFCKDRKYSN